MTNIVLIKSNDGRRKISASVKFENFPNSTDTIWSKLESLKVKYFPFAKSIELNGKWVEAASIESIAISLGDAYQEFRFLTPLVVPGLLFSSNESCLLTSADFESDISQIKQAFEARGQTAMDEAMTHAEECLMLAEEILKRELRHREFELGVKGFLGITSVGAVATSAKLALMIDAAVLLGKHQGQVEVLRASLTFSAGAALTDGSSGTADARLELIVTAGPNMFEGVVAQFQSSFDLPQLPNLPRPRL